MFFGGPVLFPLVFTMTFGIIIGTYSSIYVALPLILVWGVRRNDEAAEVLPPMTPRRQG
jgi:preprotein translocase subunit SecF